MGRYIGIDLHRNCFTACTLAVNGRYYFREWKIDDLGKFAGWLQKDDEVAVEMTGNTRFFSEAIRDKIKHLVIVNPGQFKVISKSVKKTDKNDAKTLALFLSKDMLPEVRMKDKLQAQIASLAETRDKLVKSRTVLKNKINNILSAYGVNLKKEALSSKKGLYEVLTIIPDPIPNIELEVLVEQIESLNESIKKLEANIKTESKDLEGFENLKSIKGIGDLGASIILTGIGKVKDFATSKKLVSYFGLAPRVSNSNETEHSGRITKRGNKLVRTTLLQCSLIAKRYSPYLREFHARIKARRGSGKANVALAKKFLEIIYQTLKKNRIFQDFPNFKFSEPEKKRTIPGTRREGKTYYLKSSSLLET